VEQPNSQLNTKKVKRKT